MSGHSHWSSIKRAKEATDQKRGKVFSKIARQISVVAREKGGDIDANASLRIIIDKAKKLNMPKENIERAIKRGTGESSEGRLEEFIFEAYGPGGIAIIIEGITDNKNRALGEIKQILSKNGGKLASEGSVKWMFSQQGVILIENKGSKDGLEMKAIEAGAEDIKWEDNHLVIYTKVEDLGKTKKSLENQEVEIESASLEWTAKEEVEVEQKEKAERLFDLLDEEEDVQEIYSNLA